MYKLILLDADKTLFDFDAAEYKAFFQVMAQLRIQVGQEEYDQYKAINHRLWAALEQGKMSKEEIQKTRFSLFFKSIGMEKPGQQAGQLFVDYLGKHGDLYPGALDLCAYLSQKAQLVILTNGIQSVQERRLAQSGLAPYISQLITSDAVGVSKPDPRLFDYALQEARQEDKSQVVMVGDSIQADIEGGHQYGLDTLWVNLSGLTEPKPDYTQEFQSLEALLTFFKGLYSD